MKRLPGSTVDVVRDFWLPLSAQRPLGRDHRLAPDDHSRTVWSGRI